MGIKETSKQFIPPIFIKVVQQTKNRLTSAKGPEPISLRFTLVDKGPDGDWSKSWTQSEVKERFESDFQNFDLQKTLNDPLIRETLALLEMTQVSKAAMFLDFGCGNGVYKTILNNSNFSNAWKYTGVDICSERIELCRTKYPDASFEILKEDRIPFGDNSFSITLASGVLMYLKNYCSSLKEIHRVTSKYVVISRQPIWKYNKTGIIEQKVIRESFSETHFFYAFNRNDIEKTFKECGFEIVYRDYGSEIVTVSNVSEPLVFNDYLLKVI